MRAPHGSDVPCRAAEAAMTSGYRIITIDGKAQRVRGASFIQSGNRDRAAAKYLATDRNGRQSRKWRAGEHMIQSEHVPVIVEERLGSRRQVHCSEHQADDAGVDPIEIDGLADHLAQLGGRDDGFLLKRRKFGATSSQSQPVCERSAGSVRWAAWTPGRHTTTQFSPKMPQPESAFVRQISSDNGGVDGTDGGAGNPVRPHPAFLERRVSARLVGSERPAAR